MKILNKVTVTGADDGTSIDRMYEIQQKYPFVEYGILINGKDNDSKPRFPSFKWLTELFTYQHPLNLSIHFCGIPVNDFLQNDTLPTYIDFSKVQRAQINMHGEFHYWFMSSASSLIKANPNIEFIFQLDGVNNEMIEHLHANDCKNISGLVDLSHGAGVLPEFWEAYTYKDVPIGYAGGLTPENVQDQLKKIETLTHNTWIDAETHLRSNMWKDFDLQKVIQFLENSKSWVK